MLPDDKLDALLGQVQAWVEAEAYPLEPILLQQGFAAVLPRLAEKRAQVRALGLWAPHLPSELGGLGLPLAQFARVSEALGRSPLGHFLFNCQAPDVGNMELLLKHGTAEQQARYLLPLARGETRSCFAMTEPEHAGSNPVWMSTTAEKAGDDYILNGRKWFTSAADGAAFVVVMAVTEAGARPHQRASQIIVPAGTPGFRVARNLSFMGEVGTDYLSHSEVVFEGCRVPQANRLGAEGQGFALAQERLGPGRIHHCMRWVGICERAFDLMCRRAVARELAPGEPLGRQPVVQQWIAESRAQIDAARLLVLNTAHQIDREGAHAARTNVSLIKFFTAGVLQTVLDHALQVHGALGLTDETPLAFWYRHERGARIYDGPDEVHKAVVARQILKGYGLERSQ